MKYFALFIGLNLIFLLGFSQEKNDSTIKQMEKPQPLRVEKSKSNITTKKLTKTKVPKNERHSATPANNNSKQNAQNINSNGTPVNKRVDTSKPKD